MNLGETKLYGIDKEEDWRGAFYVQDSELLERNGYFKTDKGSRIDIYIKEACGNDPHIHLQDTQEIFDFYNSLSVEEKLKLKLTGKL